MPLRRWLLPGPASLLALAIAVPIALAPPTSFDLLFHLAFGRHWLAHGFPDSDPFSFTAAGKWFPHEWTFGVAAELMLRGFGAAGPQLLTAALVATTVLLLWRALGESRGLLALGVLVLALAAQSYTWEEARPFHVGHLLFAIALLLVQRWRRGSRSAAWLLVPLTIGWANLHGSWLLAPALLAGTALGFAIDRNRPMTLAGLGLATLAWLSSSLSPGGIQTLTYPLRHALLPSTQSIQEWTPLVVGDRWGAALLALMLLTTFAAARAHRPAAALLLPVVGLSVATLGAQRHAPFTAMLLAAAATELWNTDRPASPLVSRLDAALRRMDSIARGAWPPYLALLLVALTAQSSPRDLRDVLPRDEFPMAALDALAKQPPGRVLTRFRWGGAVSYLAGDGHPTFIDGRNDPFPKAIHDEYQQLVLLEPGWEDVLARHRPQYVLWGPVNHGAALLEALRRSPEWRVLAEDDVGTLFARAE